MKKILCPSCNNIIEVENETEKLYCPHCFKNISFESGRKHLSNYVSRNFELARRMLNEATDYAKARTYYQNVLDIYQDDVEASQGLIVSTILLSTVRTSYIKEATNEILRYKNTLKVNKLTIDNSQKFIEKIDGYVDEYISTLSKRLSNNRTFYEKEGKELYLHAVKDGIRFKETLLSIFFSERAFPLKCAVNKTTLKKDIEKLKNRLNSPYSIESNPLNLLHTDVEEAYIPDIIFKDSKKLYQSRNRLMISNIITFFLFGLGVFLIFYMPNRLLIGVPIASFFALVSLILFIIQIVVQRKLNR